MPTSPHRQYEQSLPSPKQSQPQDKSLDPPVDTSSYVVVEQKIEEIVKEFDTSVGAELVEIVRTKLA